MHDNLQGIRFTPAAGNNRALLPDELRQVLYSQDVLTVEVGGGAAETDTAALLLHYDDVPGLDARLATIDQLTPRIANILTIEVVTAAGATAGDWNAGTAINATFDLLKANTDYAVLGYVTSALGNRHRGARPGHRQRPDRWPWHHRAGRDSRLVRQPVQGDQRTGYPGDQLVPTRALRRSSRSTWRRPPLSPSTSSRPS
jgi:hypothetical protein